MCFLRVPTELQLPASRVVRLGEADRESALSTLTASFLYSKQGAEPTLDWLCGPERVDDGPGGAVRAHREALVRDAFTLMWSLCFVDGACLGIKAPDGKLDAVTLCLPPDAVRHGGLITLGRVLRATLKGLPLPPLLPPTLARKHGAGVPRRLDVLDTVMTRAHEKHAGGDHWCVRGALLGCARRPLRSCQLSLTRRGAGTWWRWARARTRSPPAAAPRCCPRSRTWLPQPRAAPRPSTSSAPASSTWPTTRAAAFACRGSSC